MSRFFCAAFVIACLSLGVSAGALASGPDSEAPRSVQKWAKRGHEALPEKVVTGRVLGQPFEASFPEGKNTPVVSEAGKKEYAPGRVVTKSPICVGLDCGCDGGKKK
jgi:hypothetical protein